MGKILLLILIGVLGYWMFRSYVKSLEKKDEPPAGNAGAPDQMVRCAQCGIYLPRSEAFLRDGQVYGCKDPPCKK